MAAPYGARRDAVCSEGCPGQGAGCLAVAAQPGAEPDDQVVQGVADGGAVQGVFIAAVADARRGRQGVGDDGAGVDAGARPGGQAAFPPGRCCTVAGGTAASRPTQWMP
ncbi:hypothetical protein [Streptomyces sp. NPDC050759]|uniref:hypothetical protein n=1 Tax=Streptomyces sp. NPDC050759 TaxID=3365635 RepID=UPI0037AA252F